MIAGARVDETPPVDGTRDLLGGKSGEAALIGAGDSWRLTYGEMRNFAAQLAAFLGEQGVKPGGRVGVFLPAGPEFAIGLMGVLARQAAVMPLDVTSRGDHLLHQVVDLGPTALITSSSLAARLLAPAGVKVLTIDCNLARDTLRVGTQGGRTFELDGRSSSEAPDLRPADSASDALLISTSGTSSRPKIVRLSHFAVRHNMAAHLESLGLTRPYVGLQALGVSYSYGLIASFLSALWVGGTVMIPASADRANLLAAMVTGGARVCLGTPALFAMLIETTSSKDREALAAVEVIGVGGDYCTPFQRGVLASALPEARCFATYGLTEAGPRVTTLPCEHFLNRGSSVGLPIRGVGLEVRQEDGRSCKPGEVGNLFVRTPSLMSGYLATSADVGLEPSSLPWYSTGDQAELDNEGFLTLHGRLDRQMKLRGRRFNPAMIEQCLASHPGVISAQVVLEPSLERLVAHVKVRPWASSIERELSAHCRRNLPNALVPATIEVVAEDAFYFKNRRLYSNHGTDPATEDDHGTHRNH